MTGTLRHITYEVELQPGENLALPSALANAFGAGRWIITIEPAPKGDSTVRNHDAFLNSYEANDEGLYDDLASR